MLRLTVFFLSCWILMACTKQDNTLGIDDAHMFLLPPGQTTGAVYMRISNPREKSAVLNHVHSPIAGTVEVHNTLYEDGMMQMRRVNHLTIPPKTTFTFAPGEHHFMLFDIDKSPAVDEEFPLVLEFDDGSTLTVTVVIRRRS